MNSRQQRAYEVALRNEELRQEKRRRHNERLRLQRIRSRESAARFLESGTGHKCIACNKVITGVAHEALFPVSMSPFHVEYGGAPGFTCSAECSSSVNAIRGRS